MTKNDSTLPANPGPEKLCESGYVVPDELQAATEVAIFLNRPLLLAGAPGTGKTTYAKHVSIKEERQLYVFNTKSISQAQELFYTYDAVGHFSNKQKSAVEFIQLEALGKAIVSILGRNVVEDMLLSQQNNNSQLKILREDENRKAIVDNFLKDCDGRDAVILIDEIDKAPRDFPNDILNEIENLEFKIRELGLEIELKDTTKKNRILVLLTSNFDKNLPDAFLRRCLFYEISFPSKQVLRSIIKSHIPDISDYLFNEVIDQFESIRKDHAILKAPATSELIDCLKFLHHKNRQNVQLRTDKLLLSTLLKKSEDLNRYLPA